VTLSLTVNDPELVLALTAYSESDARQEFALCALRIGVLALKQVPGHRDADAIRAGSERLQVLADQQGAAAKFQQEVITTLSAFSTRREESLRSAVPGTECETLVCRKAGGIATHIDHAIRFINNVKAGDVVIELGSE
jgi:hypothetical protein